VPEADRKEGNHRRSGSLVSARERMVGSSLRGEKEKGRAGGGRAGSEAVVDREEKTVRGSC